MAPQRLSNYKRGKVMGRTTKAKSKVKIQRTIESRVGDRTTFFYYMFRNIVLVGLPLIMLASLVLINSHSQAAVHNSNVDNISIDLPISCTLASTGSTHNEGLINGKYDNNIGNGVTKLTTYCNDQGGYIIYTIGASNGIEGNTNLIGNNGEVITTGIATSGDTSNWAFKIAALDNSLTMNSSYTSGFASIPATWTEIAKKESGTVNSSTGSAITATYAVYVNGTQGAGTYTGQVKYAMLHPSTLNAPTNLERAFLLAGKQKITIYDDGSGAITEEDTNETTGEPNTLIGSYYKMQDMTTSICNATNTTGEASQLQLLDIRDYKTYWATKLADGHCWMTQNLDLDLISDTTAQNYVALTSENTDIDSNTCDTTNHTCDTAPYVTGYSIDQSTNVITWVPLRSTITELNSTNWKNDDNTPYSWDRGTGDNAYPENNQATAGDHGLAGNYYNWSAVIASSDSSGFTTNNTDATNSICPKGWKLPSVANLDFGNLLTAEGVVATPTSKSYLSGGFNSLTSAPLFFMRGGRVYNGILYFNGTDGYYWSSTVDAEKNALYMYIHISSVSPIAIYGRMFGMPIRCLAR